MEEMAEVVQEQAVSEEAEPVMETEISTQVKVRILS